MDFREGQLAVRRKRRKQLAAGARVVLPLPKPRSSLLILVESYAVHVAGLRECARKTTRVHLRAYGVILVLLGSQ